MFCQIFFKQIGNMSIAKTATDYAKYLDLDFPSQIQCLTSTIYEMLARLEEFQTILSFMSQDRNYYNSMITSIPKYQGEIDDLCKKIDMVEGLIAHIKDNMDTLESRVEKAETELNINESTMKVPNIFTPLFKKNTVPDRNSPSKGMEMFHTEDYFK
ncbi:unnamed protein product [Callosobruchus maculatus]|uniref:Uncharacterized protein n=1 Tax=Callosobruchus maculatus TaxID=64391 RepID=A0A653BEE5_CALMS|nr:unnamed protein product [Callosobruchus maculatus]